MNAIGVFFVIQIVYYGIDRYVKPCHVGCMQKVIDGVNTISRPGLYSLSSDAAYRADPCPEPSLTQSCAKVLLENSPLHAWTQNVRLNPGYEANSERKFDVGNIAHALLIGRGKTLEVLNFPDWRTKASQEARALCEANGKLGVLERHHALAQRMVDAAREQMALRKLDHLFNVGAGEVCLAWQEGDIWLRQLVDWLTPDGLIFADYKSTQESAAPHALARKMVSDGWDVQGAMGERGLNALDPQNQGRRRYLFVVQEQQRPYALSVCELSESVLTMGRKKLDTAVSIWRRCMTENRWPGYAADVIVPDYPGWAEAAWLDREANDNTILGAG